MLSCAQMKFPIKYILYPCLILFLCFARSEILAQEWTRFRGIQGRGIDTCLTAPVSWDSSGFRWNISLPGTGNASPVVWRNIIFVTSSDDEKDLGYLMALDEREGKVLWQKQFDVKDLAMHKDNNLASHSPAVDESQVYVVWYSKERTRLIAFSHEGALQWQAEFEGIEARHGGGNSLMLTETKVVFTREQEDSSSFRSSWVAVNKQTGETAWELERETCPRNSFSTPILVNNLKQESQLLFTSEAHGFTGVDPETGKVLWERKGLLTARVVSSPVYSDGLIIGCRNGLGVVLDVDLNTNQAGDSALYTLPRNLSPYVPTPIVVDGLLYLFIDNGTVACVDFDSGKLLWKERPAGPIYGSPVCVNGNLYCITKAGEVVVVRACSKYQLYGVYPLGEGSFSTPAMCSSGMVFRTFTRLMLLGKDKI